MTPVLQLQDGTRLALDERGYLLDWRAWRPQVAEALAARDGITLTDAHWQVLEILREYFAEYEIEPPMRALVKLLRARCGDESLGSRSLYRLFPEGPARQASRYAGLPLPVSCI